MQLHHQQIRQTGIATAARSVAPQMLIGSASAAIGVFLQLYSMHKTGQARTNFESLAGLGFAGLLGSGVSLVRNFRELRRN